MSYIATFFRFLFFPFWIICYLVYPQIRRSREFVMYSWYRTKADYDAVMKTAADDPNELIILYDIWKKKAEEALAEFDAKSIICLKVAIDPKKLNRWLAKEGRVNTAENREAYIHTVFLRANEVGFECNI